MNKFILILTRAYSTAVVRGIRIAQTRVRFSIGPQIDQPVQRLVFYYCYSSQLLLPILFAQNIHLVVARLQRYA